MSDDERAAGPVVVCCGLATLDVVQTVDHVPGPDEKLVARDLWVAAGGPAAGAAVTAAGLGTTTRLVSRLGDGPLGTLVRADLEAAGVAVVDRALPSASPAVSTVLVTAATGERAVVSVNAMQTSGSAEGALAADGGGEAETAWVGELGADGGDGERSWVERAVDRAAVLLVDGHHLDLALVLARAARRRGVPVLLDGGSWKPGLEGLLALTDVALLSADFALPGAVGGGGAVRTDGVEPGVRATSAPGRDETSDDTSFDPLPDGRQGLLGAVADLGPTVVAQSHGGAPIRLLGDDGAAVLVVGVPTVDVVDSLGAGDVLHGALAAWIVHHGAPGGADAAASGLSFAAEVASESCRGRGARGWLADGDAVARLRAALGGQVD